MDGSRRTREVDVEETAKRAERLTRLSLFLVAGYLFATTVPVIRWSVVNASRGVLVVHLLALGVAAACVFLTLPEKIRPARAWLPLVLIPLLYVELRWVVGGIGMSRKDHAIAALDVTLFHSRISSSWAQHFQIAAVSELLHLAYLSYYPIVFVPPILLWFKDRRREFAFTVLSLVIAYLICYVGSIAVPVDGPRFVNGPAAAPRGFVRALAIIILQNFSSHGSAFPSSHVAAAVVASYCAIKFQRKLGIVAAFMTVLLGIGAVYAGFHYATDVIAGAMVGGITIFIASRIERPPRPAKPPKPPPPVKVQVMQARMAQHSARRSRETKREDED